MSKNAAQAVADFLHESSGEFLAVLQREAFIRGASAALLKQWLREQLDYFAGGSSFTCEWVSLLVDKNYAKGGNIGEVISMVHRVRDVVLKYCQGKIKGISDIEMCRAVLEYETEVLRHICMVSADAERKEAAAAQRRQKTLVNSMRNAFVTLNMNGLIELSNAHFSNVIGIAEERIVGIDFLGLCRSDTAAEIKRELRQKSGSITKTINGSLVTALGAPVATQFWITPIFDAKGFRGGLAVAMTRLEPGPRFSSNAFSNLVEEIAGVLGVGHYVIDTQFRVVSANETAGMFVEVGKEDNNFNCCRNLDEQGRCRDCLRKHVFETGAPHHATVQVKTAGGDVAWTEMTCIPLRNDQGEVVHVAKLVRDVTEQKMLEGQLLHQQREGLVWHLAASLAHQLRNPLGVMIGFAEMLSKGMAPDRVHEAVHTILRNGMRCKEIVEDLMEFGHGALGEMSEVDLNALLKQRIEEVYGASRIEWRLADALPPVHCAPGQIALVALHLVDNALWAAESRVIIETHRQENSVAVRVIDDGPGVPEQDRARVFEPFFTTRRDQGGTGLGLCLSRRVVELHHGQLTLDDSVSAGACFSLTLSAARPAQKREEIETFEKPAQPTGRRVLIVEDEKDQLFLLTLALQMQGHSSDTAKTGAQAMELINSAHYDAAVIDILLADGLGGRDLFDIIKRANPKLAGKTLFITGDTMKYETRRFLQDSKRPFLEKPFMVADFTAQIDRIIKENPDTPNSP